MIRSLALILRFCFSAIFQPLIFPAETRGDFSVLISLNAFLYFDLLVDNAFWCISGTKQCAAHFQANCTFRADECYCVMMEIGFFGNTFHSRQLLSMPVSSEHH
jgi:hypothetical protein